MNDSLVVKGNDLIQARYELSIIEQKIILYAVSRLDREKDKFNMISFNVREFLEAIGVSTERHTEIKEVVRELRKKEVIIDTEGFELITGWLSSIEYKKKKGIVELEFSEKLIPYLLQLKGSFTRYLLKNVIYLKNRYSIRIYEMLKQYEHMSHDYRIFDIDKLRSILMMDASQYTRMYDFERYVLKPSVEEINQYTDIKVSYEKIKQGKQIKSIRFDVKYRSKEYSRFLEREYDIDDLKDNMGLTNENFNAVQVMELYQKAVERTQDKVDVFLYAKLNYLHMIQKDSVRNKYAYLMKSLEEDYAKAFAQLNMRYIVKEKRDEDMGD